MTGNKIQTKQCNYCINKKGKQMQL